METNSVLPSKGNVLAVCSPKLASKSPTEIVLRQWFVRFCEIAEKEFHKPFIDLWCQALNDLDPEWVEFGCRSYLRVMKFFPKPGDIRELIEKEKERIAIEQGFENFEHEIASRPQRSVPSYESARAHGEQYRKNLAALVFVPAASRSTVKVEPEPIVATNERLALLERQARDIKARFGGRQ